MTARSAIVFIFSACLILLKHFHSSHHSEIIPQNETKLKHEIVEVLNRRRRNTEHIVNKSTTDNHFTGTQVTEVKSTTSQYYFSTVKNNHTGFHENIPGNAI